MDVNPSGNLLYVAGGRALDGGILVEDAPRVGIAAGREGGDHHPVAAYRRTWRKFVPVGMTGHVTMSVK